MKTIRISETAFHFFALLTGGNYFTKASRRVLESEFVGSLVDKSIVVPEAEEAAPAFARPLNKEAVHDIISEHFNAVKGKAEGGKLPMIKFCRIVTNWGLKEAKDYIENNAFWRQMF